MERCKEYLVSEPETRKGAWRTPGRSLNLEIGCGKGSLTCALAAAEPEEDLVAIEKVPDAMILAMERAQTAGLRNVCFLDYDAAKLREIFNPEELDRIYINFCDPWPKSRDRSFASRRPHSCGSMRTCSRSEGSSGSRRTTPHSLRGRYSNWNRRAGSCGR